MLRPLNNNFNMDREIKFRAYWTQDPGKFPMRYSDAYRNSGDFLSIAQGDSLVLGPNSVHIMQFTGLKDKNGKEIYESDIVNFHIFTQELGESSPRTLNTSSSLAILLFVCLFP